MSPTENVGILFSIEKYNHGAKFNNYSDKANMIVYIGENPVFVPKDSFCIYDYDFEISKLKIYFE